MLTEGVVPYLSVDDAGVLATDLHAQASFERWVTDYFSPLLLGYLRKRRSMRNVPVRVDPPDWDALFAEHGWGIEEMRYLGEESLRFRRRTPMPLFVRLLRVVASGARWREMLRNTGYAMLVRAS